MNDAVKSPTPPQYELVRVTKTCDGPAERITILKGVNLTIHSGESIAIVGASGSGKSTLLHLLGALDTPTDGSLLFEGESLPDFSEEKRRGSVTADLALFFSFTICCPNFPPRKMLPCRP